MDQTLVLGLGNILCGDEGIGCRVVEHLYATMLFPENVTINDGGTMGQELLGRVAAADNLLVIDCADFGLNPGEFIKKQTREIPIWLGMGKMSPHQANFAEVLALAQLKNQLPKKMALLAIQPKTILFGEKLSPFMVNKIPDYAQYALEMLAEWNITGKMRKTVKFLNTSPTGLQFCEPAWKTELLKNLQ